MEMDGNLLIDIKQNMVLGNVNGVKMKLSLIQDENYHNI
jgi:hypothetical protein